MSAKSVPWLIGATILLIAAVIFTGSRTGIALLVIALLAQWLTIGSAVDGLPRRSPRPIRLLKMGLPILAGVIAAGGVAVSLLGPRTSLGRVTDRFAIEGDLRWELWADSWVALLAKWPFGGGLGSYIPSILPSERLEQLSPGFPNRAHNDYLEFGIEAGLPGVIALVMVAIIFVVMAVRAWRERPHDRPLAVLSVAIFTVVSLHSFVDYPLRSMAIACLAGVAAGLLVKSPGKEEG
jgi:O-antigen ligase